MPTAARDRLGRTDALFTGELNARKSAQTELDWLTDRWSLPV
jgi:hypothetical protein